MGIMSVRVKRIIGGGCFVLVTLIIALFIQKKLNMKHELFQEISFAEIDEKAQADTDVYLWVYSTDCASCRKLFNDVNAIKKENDIFSDKTIYGMNIDEYDGDVGDVLGRYRLEGVPFIVRYRDGVVKDVLYEDIDKAEIVAFFQSGTEAKLDVQYFFSPTCNSCASLSEYLERLAKDYPDINIQKHNVTDAQNKGLLNLYCDHYKVDTEIAGTVPIVFARNQYLVDDEIENNLKKIIEDTTAGDTAVIAADGIDFQKEQSVIKNIDFWKLVAAAFLNGLNPCSFSMLFFLLMIIEAESKKVLSCGMCFCLGKVVTLVLLGTLLYGVISSIQSSIMIKIVNIILIGLMLFLAVLNLNDFVALKQNRLDRIKAQLPEGIRKANNKLIKNTLGQFYNSGWFLPICVLLGAAISFTEFLCSGQLYLFSIITIIHVESELTAKAFLCLVTYSVVCVIPLMIAIVLISLGKKVLSVSVVISENTATIKIIYALAFAAMAAAMLFQLMRW